MKTVKTNKGTALPLINLKGKDYLQVAHRLQWFVEENTRYTIVTYFLALSPEETVATVTVNLFDEQGSLLKTVQGTKRETKKDFNDHTEKAETGALGRALISLGYGTQYALSDLDEGTRIVDSPVTDVRNTGLVIKTQPLNVPTASGFNTIEATEVPKPLDLTETKKSSFRKPRAAKTDTKETTPVLGNGSTKEEDFFGN